MKNIVFIVAIGDKSEYQYCINSWKYWCEKNNCELFVMEDFIVDSKEMHIIWQRYFLFDLLDHNNIKYKQICLVDADTIIHPDCPNFFNLTDNKYCMVHDNGSYDWILRGMEHYKKYLFKDMWFDFWEYGNAGYQIVNKNHKKFFKTIINFYFKNREIIENIRTKFGIGSDQTVLNFMLQKNNIDLNLLPYEFNMTSLVKREILGDDMLYTKLGWIYHFNGIPEKEKNVPRLMKQVYIYLYKGL